MVNKSLSRINGLDYLRGLMALAVMGYHFTSWSSGVPQSDSLIGRLGVYAVSIFYIISGASLFIAYNRTKWNFSETGTFIIKRYLRIAPAFWFAMGLMIYLAFLKSGNFIPDWSKYLSNITLTFGFHNPRNYIPGGGWSIGNEMVFYAFFPFLILSSRNIIVFATLMTLLLAAYIFFAFSVLTPADTLAHQWEEYINPLNQAFLFALGILIAWWRDKRGVPRQIVVIGVSIFSLIFLTFYPAEGNQINIVSGINRIMFTIFCAGLCFGALNWELNLNPKLSSSLKFFGDISYPLYLFHSVFAAYTLQLILPGFDKFSPTTVMAILFFLVAPISITFSYAFFRMIENPSIQAGKKIASGVRPRRAIKHSI